MRVYHMPFDGVMDLPMRVFWHLSGTVPRLIAEESRNLLELLATAQSGEAAVEKLSQLDKQAPEPIKFTGAAIIKATSERDEGGFQELKMMAG